MAVSAQVWATIVALVAAFGFAVSTSLQHRAAGSSTQVNGNPLRLLLVLVRHRLWLAGAVVGLTAWLLHALALTLGSLALIQPLMLTGVVLAVVVRAAIEHTRPTRTELAGVVLVVAGLATLLPIVSVTAGAESPHGGRAVVIVAGVLTVTLVVIGRTTALQSRGGARALGAAAGLDFAVTAMLLKLTGTRIAESGPVGVFGWSGAALLTCGLLGVAVNQRAYQSGRLSESMPVLNAVTTIGAFVLGVVVLGERVRVADEQLALVVPAVAAVLYGLRLLAPSPPHPEEEVLPCTAGH